MTHPNAGGPGAPPPLGWCSRHLVDHKHVPAVTMRAGTALCERCHDTTDGRAISIRNGGQEAGRR